MQLRDTLLIFRRRWVSMVLVLVTTLLAAAVVTALIPPRFTASTSVFFDVRGGSSVDDLAQASDFVESRMPSYARVSTSPLILGPVISDLSLPLTTKELADDVTAAVPEGTVILTIAASSDSAQKAADIANAVASRVVSTVPTTLAPAASGSIPAVRVVVLAAATPAEALRSPGVARSLGLGLVLALLLAAGTAALRHAFDTRIRSEADVRGLSGSAVVGAVPLDRAAPLHPVARQADPLGPRSEAMRRLRTNLLFLHGPDASAPIVITSSIPEEGKTLTAVNLAISLADAGLRVLLVDADLRRPSVARLLDLQAPAGLTTVLERRVPVPEVVQRWGASTLDVLSSGPLPANPSELLGSMAMESLLRQLSATYDMVLIDTPPLLTAADGVVLSRAAGSALVVVGMDGTQRSQLEAGLESLTMVGANVVGLVLNRVPTGEYRPFVRTTARVQSRVMELRQGGLSQGLGSRPGARAGRPGTEGGPRRASGH